MIFCGHLVCLREKRMVGYVNWRPGLKLILPVSSFNVSPVTALKATWFKIAKKTSKQNRNKQQPPPPPKKPH